MNPIPFPSRLRFAGPLLGAALALGAGSVQAEQDFTAEPCCQLCPAAMNAASYDTKYLDFFNTLVEADDDWLFRTENDLRTEFGPSDYGYRQLKRVSELLRSKGSELVIVYQPTRGLVHPDKLRPEDRRRFDYDGARANYAEALRRFREQGIWVPDLTPLLAESGDEPYFFRGDHHWTPYGAQRTARHVADTIKQIPAFADVPRQAFESQRNGLLGKRGTLHKAAGQLCGTSYADQYVERFVTEPVGDEASSSDDLFGEQGDPQIVLVGTSNSGEAYNFPGFLREYLGADLLNLSLAGGGYDTSLMQYLASEDFHRAPPKIIVWEFEPHYDLAQEKFYRQVVPLLENGCEGRQVALRNSVPVRRGSNEVLVNGKHQPLQELRGGDYLLDIRFSDPSVRELRAELWYMTGRREQVKLEHSAAADGNGRFVFDLRNGPGWAELTFLALELQSPEDMPQGDLSVDARLCKRAAAGSQLTAQAD